MSSLGVNALVNILVLVVCIGVSWWALQAFRFDLFLHKPDSIQAKCLQILLSVFLGYGVGKFLMEYLGFSLLLRNLFV